MIAMGIAPALFDHEHAVNALQSGIASLYGAPSQLGVKTLAASDPHYRCYYDNQMSFQGDIEVCDGFSYHNVGSIPFPFRRVPSGCGRRGSSWRL